ncbi:MAG: hypothetical protein ACR2JU_14490 [Nocardioidaceae bacterium]
MIRVWQIDAGGYVAGYGSREIVVDTGCTKPVWSSRHRAWCVAPHRLADVLALAEHRGRRVAWLGVRDAA